MARVAYSGGVPGWGGMVVWCGVVVPY